MPSLGVPPPAARVDAKKEPGATTSGLNRPPSPSTPMPTLPRAEYEATCDELSVLGKKSSLVSDRKLSRAPTVITFLAVDGERTEPGVPPEPS